MSDTACTVVPIHLRSYACPLWANVVLCTQRGQIDACIPCAVRETVWATLTYGSAHYHNDELLPADRELMQTLFDNVRQWAEPQANLRYPVLLTYTYMAFLRLSGLDAEGTDHA